MVSAPQASTADGALSLSSIDHEKQEGARLLVWQGKARMALLSQQPLDLDRETNGDVLLVVTLRVDALPADVSVDLQARSGGTQVVTLPLTATLSALDQGVWTRIGIPLKCLRTAGADTAALDVPFALQAGAGVQIALADVRAATDYDQLLACPTQ